MRGQGTSRERVNLIQCIASTDLQAPKYLQLYVDLMTFTLDLLISKCDAGHCCTSVKLCTCMPLFVELIRGTGQTDDR